MPAVFCVKGAPKSWHRDVMAACLWAGDGVASHRAAAKVWSLHGSLFTPVEISTTTSRRPPRSGFIVHRVSDHINRETTHVDNLPVTSVRRTLLDLAGTKHPPMEQALDEALRKQLVGLDELWLLYDEDWTRGRRGIAIMRELLIQRTPGEAPTQSELESMLIRLTFEYHLPRPEPQYPIVANGRTVHVDFAYPDKGLAIELDGYAWHMDRHAFERDRERDNDLQVLGWRVLRFTWAKLRWHPDYVAQVLRANLLRPSG